MSYNCALNLIPTSLDLRDTLLNLSTTTIDDFVVVKGTGQVLGRYNRSPYQSQPAHYEVGKAKIRSTTSRYVVSDNGSPSPLIDDECSSNARAEVIPFPALPVSNAKSNAGSKQRAVQNPFYILFELATFENVKLPWLSNYVHGAIHVGPGIINGRYSVSASDIIRLLHLPVISRDTAMKVLVNHEGDTMSKTQVDRVVQAVRVALGGIALYLERNPDVLCNFDLSVDHDLFWQQRKEVDLVKVEALKLLAYGVKIVDVARAVDRSRNTVSAWKREASNNAQFAPD